METTWQKFMAQVGIHADPAVTSKWQGRSIPDDPIGMMSNKRGTFSFATSGDTSHILSKKKICAVEITTQFKTHV